MEVTHSQRRLAAARVHLEREESIKSLKAAHAASSASTRATAARGRNSGGSEEAKEPTIRERKLRSDCVLANLRPVAVLGEGAFGVVQLVEHTVGWESVGALVRQGEGGGLQTGEGAGHSPFCGCVWFRPIRKRRRCLR